jgi:hypothetical protein
MKKKMTLAYLRSLPDGPSILKWIKKNHREDLLEGIVDIKKT